MISIDRAKKIILCYGGYPLAWPEQEREAVLQLLPDSKSLSDLQIEALALDGFLGFSDHNEDTVDWALDQQCTAKIMAQLPEQMQNVEQAPVAFIGIWRNRALKISKPIMLAASVALAVFGLSNNLQLDNTKAEAEQLSLSEYMTLYVDDALFDSEVAVNDEQLEIFAFLEPQIMDDYI